MKKIVVLFIYVLSVGVVYAQGEMMMHQNPQAREKIKAAHIAFITERLSLTPDEAEKFWPVYHEFNQKRMALRQQFEQKKNNPDPAKSTEQNEKEMIEQGLKIKQQELDLEKEYSGKLMNVVSPKKVMELRKAEEDFRMLVIKQIQHRQQQRQNSDQRFRQRN